MATEIERKFLVPDDSWRNGEQGTSMRQGYLALTRERAIRVRIAERTATLNIKAVKEDLVHREEFEYTIPLDDAEQLLAEHCTGSIIEKTRYKVKHGNYTWEVDVFEGANEGLVIGEIELDSADAEFDEPPWIGEEVSNDPRYLNSSLCIHPYSEWRKD